MAEISFFSAKDVGLQIHEAIFGATPFVMKPFVKLQDLGTPPAGSVVSVTMEDPFTFGSDTRTIALVWDDNPALIATFGTMEEGSSKSFPVGPIVGKSLSVWCDDSIECRIITTTATDAQKIEEQHNEGTADGLFEKFRELQKAATDQMNVILIGGAVVVVIGIIAAAWALPRSKITKIG